MPHCDVLVVAGTHGNELNAPWLLEQWDRDPAAVRAAGLTCRRVIGNPEARSAGRRYVDRDLNRSFRPDLLAGEGAEVELLRARELLRVHGPDAESPCRVALDLHSTTAGMGSSLVVYGRRPADLALAAGVQRRLGLPVYLHEADAAQTGFLVERWPCGLVIEVGPVPQGVLDSRVVTQTQLALEACLAVLSAACSGDAPQPRDLVLHRHLRSLDLPRDAQGQPSALLHPLCQGSDWRPLTAGAPLLRRIDGSATVVPDDAAGLTPVFINEAAYAEKRIALSLTRREVWPVDPGWIKALGNLMLG